MTPHLPRLLLALALAGAGASAPRAQEARVPEPTALAVSDFAGLLDGGSRAALEQKLRGYRDRSGRQLVFISVPVAWRGNQSTEQYSMAIAERWQIGTKRDDDGLIFLVIGTPQDRRGRDIRFEVGYGLEGDLPDAICKRIQMEQVVPRLQAGDYAGAVNGGMDAIIARLSGPAPPGASPSAPQYEPPVVSWWARFWEILKTLLIFSLALGFIGLRIWLRHRWNRWTGGSSGWRSGSGGGFGGWGGGGFSGGFSGGGGSFGGGGATSRW